MKALEWTAIAVAIPLDKATRISTRVINHRDFLLVQVRDPESQLIGLGYTYIGSHGAKTAVQAFSELVAPLLNNPSLNGNNQTMQEIRSELLLVGRGGLITRVLSAVDIALWDLHAKRANTPLGILLGGNLEPVSAYASGGYYYQGLDFEEFVREEIRDNIAAGFTSHKIKVGGLDVSSDARRIRAAITELPQGHRLALDANNAFKSEHEAARALEAYESAAGAAGLWWFEEPLAPDEVSGHAFLKARFSTPIATGELLQSHMQVRPFIEQNAIDIIQIDVGVIGGITEFNKISNAVEVAGITLAPHWHANVHAVLASLSGNFLAVEHFALNKDIYNFEKIVTKETRLEYGNGLVVPSTRPGLGIEIDSDLIQKFKVGEFNWV